ncbi:speckle-type POZ protein-like [Daphnia pulicaria]|uniref:speckle-type POZ protein-like n=1 Tax=Daphnia pulicaria TaxID=35523 RepID=UPI001EEBCBCA|nr:speckle-type POZ protein-like [Daphnia pulicaria]
MSDQGGKKVDVETQLETLPPSSKISYWCGTHNGMTKIDYELTIQRLATLETFKDWEEYLSCTFFKELTGDPKLILHFYDIDPCIKIDLSLKFQTQSGSPVRVQIAISNENGEKIFSQQHYLAKGTTFPRYVFQIEKRSLMESECFVNGQLTIHCEIEYLIPNRYKPYEMSDKSPTQPDLHEKPFNNSNQLIAHLEELYETIKFSDFTINVRGRQFKAHKSILATRSQYFAAMFEHPTKENLTHQVEIEDVEPDVFQEILRFLYTGRLSESTMGKMSAGILAAADKYMLEQLKMECENQFIHRMSAENCLELLVITDEHHPAFHLRKYAVEFFRRCLREVMATDEWEKAEQSHPEQCFKMLKLLVKFPF